MFSIKTMLEQYKSHIWGLTEYSNGVLILAAPCQLRRLDKVQRWFLHELGISDTFAFVQFNFAPPTLRRNIGLMNFLQNTLCNNAHPALCHALPYVPADLCSTYHSKALDPCRDVVMYHTRLYERSLYAYILAYNRLPQALVDAPTVSNFQARLTHLATQRASNANDSWRRCFQNCEQVHYMFYA